MAEKTLSIKLSLNDKQFQSSLKKSMRSMKKFGGNMKSFGQTLSRNVTLPIVALGAASVAAFDKQAKAVAQVEAGLISTGNAAGFTSQQLQKMAADLQAKTIFGDEVILKDATAQLLTFTNIAGEQFARTQKAALNLATRLDGDLKSASIQLGKALNDPIANLSALSRSGIQFSEEQKAIIKSLAKTNKLAEAQTIILDELEKQYGGAAEAAAEAGLGPFQQLQNSLSDVSEEFGKLIVENIEPFKNLLLDVIKVLRSLTDEQKKAIVKFAGYAAVIGPVVVVLGSLISSLSIVIPLVLKFVAAFNPITAAIGAAVLAVGYFAKRMVDLNDEWKEYQETTDELDLGPVVGDFEKLSKLTDVVAKNTKKISFKKSAIPQRIASKKPGAIATDTGIPETLEGVAAIEPSGLESFNEAFFSFSEDFRNSLMNTFTEITNIIGKVGALFGQMHQKQLTELELVRKTEVDNIMAMSIAEEEKNKMIAKSDEKFEKKKADLERKRAKRAKAVAIFEAIVNTAAAVVKALPNLPLAIATGVLGTAQIGTIASTPLPAFADGGIVSGPTVGLMGEYAGANTNPEVIAPLNKLKDMIGGQTVQVQGVISGEDIFLSNDRYSRRKNSY
jgi:BMFP domain-containing protein YqiC